VGESRVSNLDEDGFSLPSNGEFPRKSPPPMVAMPKVFDGCDSRDAAIIKMISVLYEPAAIEIDGYDTMYRRLADALILVLANQGGLSP
jgi:hypothetical protein